MAAFFVTASDGAACISALLSSLFCYVSGRFQCAKCSSTAVSIIEYVGHADGSAAAQSVPHLSALEGQYERLQHGARL